jgi:YVTN family beta-propeller protein
VAITPDGAFAYVTNEYASTVSVIDTASNTVVDTVTGVAVAPEGVAIKRQSNAVTCR